MVCSPIAMVIYGGRLFVNDGFMVEAGGLLNHLSHGAGSDEDIPFIVVPLLGRFKNEDGEKWHQALTRKNLRYFGKGK